LYALSGQKDEAHALLDAQLKTANSRYVSPFAIAQIYSVLNERDQAFLWLEKAIELRDTTVVNLNRDPLFKNLRSDLPVRGTETTNRFLAVDYTRRPLLSDPYSGT